MVWRESGGAKAMSLQRRNLVFEVRDLVAFSSKELWFITVL